MILYHAISTYQLLSWMIHKKKYHKQEEACIIISEWLSEKFPDYQLLEKEFKYILITSGNIMLNQNESYKTGTEKYYNELFAEIKLSIGDFNEIYVGGAHYIFGIYLSENKIPFIYLEDACGMLTRSELLYSIDKKNASTRSKKCLENGLYDGSNQYIKRILCNIDVQLDKYYEKDKTDHFNPVELLIDLPSKEREDVISFFIFSEKISIPENSVLLLTQHFANLKILSFEEQILIYQIVVDYFFDGYNVVIKPHPDDIIYYDVLFPKAYIIREKFPSEFIPFIFDNKPDIISTVSSTSIYPLRNLFDKKIEFSPRFEKDFIFTHRYYTAIHLIQFINKRLTNIYVSGSNQLLIEYLLEYGELKSNRFKIFNMDNGQEYKENLYAKLREITNSVFIIDDASYFEINIVSFLEDIHSSNLVIFVNSLQDYCFYDYFHKNIWDNIIPITINKHRTRNEEFYAGCDQEVIYLYTKDKEFQEMAKEHKFNKCLEGTGLEISSIELTPEQVRIKVLEGILEATEKRLLYYINKYDTNTEEK